MRRRHLVAVSLPFFVLSCGGASTGGTPDGSVAPDASPPDGGVSPDTASPDAAGPPTIDPFAGGVPGFNLAAVVEEGYWYSRYNLGSLVMKSALGQVFAPPDDMPPMLVKMVSDAVSTAKVPAGPSLLQRVGNAGNPAYLKPDDGEPMNLADEVWTATIDPGSSTAAVGWTMIKEVEWGKQFHVDSHFGVVGPDDKKPGAQQRFEGLVLYAESVVQAMEFAKNRGAFDTSDVGGNYVMLAALSDLQMVTAAPTAPKSATNRMRDVGGAMAAGMGLVDADGLAAWLLKQADTWYSEIKAQKPADLEDRALATIGLAWYGAASATNRAEVKALVKAYGDELLAAPRAGVPATARALRGLLEAARLTGDARYAKAAEDAFASLVADYRGSTGSFAGVTRYTADDVAWVVGALGSMLVNGKADLMDSAKKVLVGFFEATVDVAGLQIAAPAYAEIPAYEQFPSEIFHRYPGMPTPRAAGGANGIAPVFASEVTFDTASGKWSARTDRFDTAGAMHLANVMLWLHVDEVDGYPKVP